MAFTVQAIRQVSNNQSGKEKQIARQPRILELTETHMAQDETALKHLAYSFPAREHNIAITKLIRL